ncbi:MAG: bifunctional hydroxymethylpyrimidine kinase/phosphomethylpyrimidine kinase [Candidatus Bathyarchaeia archaeon]
MRSLIPRVLTIAGSDSGGGAGIQADLKTLAALGVYGATALTAVTAQNTVGVSAIQDVDPGVVRAQIRAVLDDIGVDAVKTGMLHTPEIIETVSEELERVKSPIVVDPVMVAKSGAPLLEDRALKTLRDKLIPLSTVVTPNIPEAEKIAGIEDIRSIEDAERAAEIISGLGARAVVVKGGHLPTPGKAVDILYFDGRFRLFEGERFESEATHGTGCSFASAIAAELAKGRQIPEAVEKAKGFIAYAIKFGFKIGRGHGPVNPMAVLYNDSERYRVIVELRKAVQMLEAHPVVSRLSPEVQMNLVMALPHAMGRMDVAGIPGRIVKLDERVKASAPPEFGSSKHVANTVLAAMRYDPDIRSGMNIKYSEEILKACEALLYKVSGYDRRMEPPEVKEKEGGTTRWGAEEAIKKLGEVPDLIYHEGDWGKEPVSTILGRSATDVAMKAVRIALALKGERPDQVL